jgi:hypothetical protein
MSPLPGPWLWVVLIGLGIGGGFPLGLPVIAWRDPDGAATTGLVLGTGYTVAGPRSAADGPTHRPGRGITAAILVVTPPPSESRPPSSDIGDPSVPKHRPLTDVKEESTLNQPMPTKLASVAHRACIIDGIEIFYREAGPPEAPVVLLPHGFPSLSFQYRNLERAACRCRAPQGWVARGKARPGAISRPLKHRKRDTPYRSAERYGVRDQARSCQGREVMSLVRVF